MDIATVNMESQSCPYNMESLYSCRSGIYNQHISFRVSYDLQYVGVSADKDVGTILIYQIQSTDIVSSRIASYMGHQDLHPFTLKETVHRMDEPEVMIVTIASYSYQRFEASDLSSQVHSSPEISSMPDLIYRCEEFLELSVEYAMSVRYESDVHFRFDWYTANIENFSKTISPDIQVEHI